MPEAEARALIAWLSYDQKLALFDFIRLIRGEITLDEACTNFPQHADLIRAEYLKWEAET